MFRWILRPGSRPLSGGVGTRPRARCDGCGDQQHVRSQHARGVQGLGRSRSRGLSRKCDSAIRLVRHASFDSAPRHDLPMFGACEIRRISHDVSATRKSQSQAHQHEVGYPAVRRTFAGFTMSSIIRWPSQRLTTRRPSFASTALSLSSTYRRRCPTTHSTAARTVSTVWARLFCLASPCSSWRIDARTHSKRSTLREVARPVRQRHVTSPLPRMRIMSDRMLLKCAAAVKQT
jgi:hypothetical protein